MNKGKTFVLKLFIIAACLVIVDIGGGKLLHHFYFRIRHGEQGRMTYIIDSTRDAILVLGSSRASHHYVSTIISDSLHLSCYNAGKDKQGLFYDLSIFKMVLLRYHPREVILDLTPASFIATESGWDELSVLLPYYRQHPEIREIIDKRSPWEWLKTYSSLYLYNSLVLQIAFNNLSAERDGGAINGYVPEYGDIDKTIARQPYAIQTSSNLSNPAQPHPPTLVNEPPDSAVVGAFEEIISLAKQNGCKLAIVVSPVFFSLPADNATTRLAKKIGSLQQIPFFDYTRSSVFTGNAALFHDEAHLNNTGAAIFTRMLCGDLTAIGFSAGGTQSPEITAPH